MVRNAEKAKTPVMCVVGEKEREDGEASLSFNCISRFAISHRHKLNDFPAVAQLGACQPTSELQQLNIVKNMYDGKAFLDLQGACRCGCMGMEILVCSPRKT